MSVVDGKTILTAARQLEQDFVEGLERLVTLESPSLDATAGDRLADALETWMTREGWHVERLARSEAGDLLVGRMGGEPDGTGTLLLAHYDTVWPIGTLEDMPFERDGDVARGPGTVDMKAGIVTALLAVRLARSLGDVNGPVSLLVTSDEETGGTHSRAVIEEEAQRHARVLVVEPGADEGAYKVGRKGVGDVQVTFSGVSAHAGLEPEKGASALRELSAFLPFAEALSEPEVGTTVNVTVASGGSAGNVIAESAHASLDVRVLRMDEGTRVMEALHAYAPRDPRVKVHVSGGLNRPPLEATEPNRVLTAEAERVANRLGLPWRVAVVGGASDGNFTSALGIATLDGLGSVGEGAHARHEHVRISATLDRVALMAGLLLGVGTA